MELDVSAVADLCLSLKSAAQAMRDEAMRRQRLAAAVAYVPTPAIAFPAAALPFAPTADTFGPQSGWNWAVQGLRVVGFGAATDFINVYRGTSPAHVQPQNFLQTFAPVAAANLVAAPWHPGGKGLILKGQGQDGLVFAGTFTGTLCVVSADVVQVTDEMLPEFLL